LARYFFSILFLTKGREKPFFGKFFTDSFETKSDAVILSSN
jgi:hypothetical protein